MRRLALLLTLLLFSCQANNIHSKGIVISSSSDPKSFNPIIANETSTTTITSRLFEGLVKTNGVTQEPEPNLAKSWKISPDGKFWKFFLAIIQ